ncbi:polysaccharide deacetylase family protein [Metabacillus iocasae]|uniref:Sporulation protein (Polysaccharide deacetylase family) n=1 Tax=Priestia iocasae TaxID=2291674 RepID=A0ABS2QRS0_9BACI|nr:polysaccharide deacetylase family protein [Metabacillus iocasae]MBM7701913.1 putative sporulation protein (polysaccharide deacetylase family) [Metabacillus iocasae]
MKRILVKVVPFVFLLTITYQFLHNPFTTSFVEDLKVDTLTVSKQKDSLYVEIQQKSKQYEIEPKDARVDKVWKLVPGYNGLKVDVEASYKSMKKFGAFDESKLIYKQVKPNVHLSDLPAQPIYRGHEEKPMVSFIINVAWGNEYIPQMLDTLKKHHVKATFFLEGRWVKNNPDMTKVILDAGHEVGNHSYSHPNMATLTNARSREELVKTNDVMKSITGEDNKWFAPPSGSYRQETVDVAAELKMGTIMWSVDTIDWQKPQPDVLIQRVMSKIHPGAIILMHPTESTATSLDTLIQKIKSKQLEISNVSTLLDEQRIIK